MLGLIEKINKRHAELTTEKIHIKNLVAIEKECWRANVSEECMLNESVKYLNKLKLTKERHPFLVGFRNDLNKMFADRVYDRDKMKELYRSLFEYKRTLQ